MAQDEADQKTRADQLRKQIEELTSADEDPKDKPERQPDESPKEYLERRGREIARKKKHRRK